MPKQILIVKNITREGPGLLEELLKERKISYKIIDLHQGESFPEVQNFSAVVVLGGPDSANDRNNKMENELIRISEVLEAQIPYLGICLGLQILVKAVGGRVVKNTVKEIGFRDPKGANFTVKLTETGRQDPLFRNLNDQFKVFHLHGETVELTKDMTLLAKGEFCENQVVKVAEKAYGLQCHFELTPEMFEVWIKEDPDLLLLDKTQLRNDFSLIQAEYTHVGQKLFNNFLNLAGF